MNKNIEIEEERKAAKRKYYQKHKHKRILTEEQKEKARQRAKLWKKEHLDESKNKNKEWRKTPIGRASHQIGNYKQDDKHYNRELPNFDSKWMVENIYSKPCYYCGETDWTKLGCDRIDNNKGHTKANVICSCWRCNDLRGRTKLSVEDFKEYIKANFSPS